MRSQNLFTSWQKSFKVIKDVDLNIFVLLEPVRRLLDICV